MKVIGLTGPIAAGKNAVARILLKQGAEIIDADRLAQTLYAPQAPLWRELIKSFGSKILKRGGEINRKKLGEVVFADQEKLRLLNRLIHPVLKEKVVEEIERRAQSVESRTQVLVINAAVLKEIGLVAVVDEVWVVLAARARRLKRLLRAGLSKKSALARINSQASQQEYVAIADRVIRNDGSLKQLSRNVGIVLKPKPPRHF